MQAFMGVENELCGVKVIPYHTSLRRAEQLEVVLAKIQGLADEKNEAKKNAKSPDKALRDDDFNKRIAVLYRDMAGILLQFPDGLPDVEWFASPDFERSALLDYRNFFLIRLMEV
jgi:hypothetical protein